MATAAGKEGAGKKDGQGRVRCGVGFSTGAYCGTASILVYFGENTPQRVY
jgi:hypothetical protein